MMVELVCRVHADTDFRWLVETEAGKAWVRKEKVEIDFEGREALLIIDSDKAKEKNLI